MVTFAVVLLSKFISSALTVLLLKNVIFLRNIHYTVDSHLQNCHIWPVTTVTST